MNHQRNLYASINHAGVINKLVSMAISYAEGACDLMSFDWTSHHLESVLLEKSRAFCIHVEHAHATVARIYKLSGFTDVRVTCESVCNVMDSNKIDATNAAIGQALARVCSEKSLLSGVFDMVYKSMPRPVTNLSNV